MEVKETQICDCNGKPIQVVHLANSADRLPTNVKAMMGPSFRLAPTVQSENRTPRK